MATKSVYQDFDTDALDHFGLDSTPLYGVLTSSGVEDVLVNQDETKYNKIKSLLTDCTETDQTFINKKKAFILPKCDVSQDRIKAALKEHKITVTNDYTLADLVIGHNNISKKIQNGENIASTVMLARLWNMEAILAGSSSHSFIQNHPNPIIVTDKITSKVRYYDLDIANSLYDEWMFTGMAVNLAYRIDIGEVGVVDVETILHSSANKVELTEDLLDYLKTLCNSHDTDNLAIASKIIPTIDYTKNHHLLWQMTQDLEYRMSSFNRDKDVQYWLEQSNFGFISRKSAEGMILYLEEEGLLNKTTFKYFEPIVRKNIQIYNRELYVFKVQVKPEYLKYLKND